MDSLSLQQEDALIGDIDDFEVKTRRKIIEAKEKARPGLYCG